jgi:hypothetical protein
MLSKRSLEKIIKKFERLTEKNDERILQLEELIGDMLDDQKRWEDDLQNLKSILSKEYNE